MCNELHIFLSCLHRLTQCSRMFLARDQKCLCLLEDTAGKLSPSAPSPRSGEGWGEAAALWILLANSLRLLPLHAVERAGVRPPPFGYCWRTLSVCSLSTQWRGLGQESSGGALQRPPPFGFASSILKDVDPASLPLDVGQFLRYLAVSHAKHIHATHMPATPVSICPIVLPASDVAIFMCDHPLGLENGIRR